MRERKRIEPPEVCPVCGELVPEGATACPGCGSDETSGWSEAGQAEALGLPGGEFEYEEYVKREFGEEGGKEPGRRRFWWWVALGVTAAFIWLVVRGIWR